MEYPLRFYTVIPALPAPITDFPNRFENLRIVLFQLRLPQADYQSSKRIKDDTVPSNSCS